MKKEQFVYTRLTDMTVGIQSQPDCNLQLLRGKALLNEKENRMLFVQNTPRGPRSEQMMRTSHSRLVRTPQGSCTLTFRFWPTEKGVWDKLVDEMIEVRTANETEFINNQDRKDNNDEV